MITPTITVDQRALDKYLAVLDKNRGKPLLTRAERVIAGAAKLAVPALKAAAPPSTGRRPTSSGPLLILNRKRYRTLASTSGTKRLRKRGGEVIAPTWLGYKKFTSRWLQEGTSSHSLQREGVSYAPGQRGRWTNTGPTANTTRNSYWRSALAHISDDWVVPLASIHVSGISGRPLVDTAWGSVQSEIYGRIERDIWETS